jgi:tRNA A-37 threonylcarbamoyl transferase component Bud32
MKSAIELYKLKQHRSQEDGTLKNPRNARMTRRTRSYPTTDPWKPQSEGPPSGYVSLLGRNWQVWVDPSRVDARILKSYTTYSDFVGLPGTILKDERRTKISCIHDWPGPGDSQPVEVVMKLYRYSHWARVRTMCAHSKAQREFDGLHFCRELGVPAVEPVAWGEEHAPAGMVRSCFVITRYLRGSVTLRDWLRTGHYSEPGGKRLLAQVMSEMGESFRRMHGAGFFHFRPATKDFLVCGGNDGRLAWNILDFPYARFMGRGMLAQWAQKRDLGTLLASVTKYADAEAFEPFWTTYLPDPVSGVLPEELVRRARRKEQALIHRNPMKRAERSVKRWMKRDSEITSLPLRKR